MFTQRLLLIKQSKLSADDKLANEPFLGAAKNSMCAMWPAPWDASLEYFSMLSNLSKSLEMEEPLSGAARDFDLQEVVVR